MRSHGSGDDAVLAMKEVAHMTAMTNDQSAFLEELKGKLGPDSETADHQLAQHYPACIDTRAELAGLQARHARQAQTIKLLEGLLWAREYFGAEEEQEQTVRPKVSLRICPSGQTMIGDAEEQRNGHEEI